MSATSLLEQRIEAAIDGMIASANPREKGGGYLNCLSREPLISYFDSPKEARLFISILFKRCFENNPEKLLEAIKEWLTISEGDISPLVDDAIMDAAIAFIEQIHGEMATISDLHNICWLKDIQRDDNHSGRATRLIRRMIEDSSIPTTEICQIVSENKYSAEIMRIVIVAMVEFRNNPLKVYEDYKLYWQGRIGELSKIDKVKRLVAQVSILLELSWHIDPFIQQKVKEAYCELLNSFITHEDAKLWLSTQISQSKMDIIRNILDSDRP